MPTVLRIKGYRFFFFSNEGTEPIHIHIEQAECYAKYWIDPIRLASDFGFTSKQLKEKKGLIETHRTVIIEKWNEHFTK